MKRILIMVLGLTALMSLNAWTQQKKSETKATTATAKAMTVVGTVSADEKSFVNDKDKKTWTVDNPEALKGHGGHHVSLRASVDSAKNEIHVLSVKMLTGSTKRATKPKSSY
jgi:hypothetical protein